MIKHILLILGCAAFFSCHLYGQNEQTDSIAGISMEDWKHLSSDIEKPDRSLIYPVTYNLTLFSMTIGAAFLFYTKEELHWDDVRPENLTDNLTLQSYRWDNDRFFFNYVAHPYTGSESYLRFRMRGFTGFESFLFSLTMSSIWEYFVEGWVEPVSVQDMVVTPCAGAVLGELRFRLKLFMKKQNSFMGDVGHFIVDPAQTIVDGVYSLFSSKKDAPEVHFHLIFEHDSFRVMF